MGIGIASTTYDLDGAVYFSTILDGSKIHDVQRRMTRTATLDGSAVIYDTGYSDADRDIVVRTPSRSREFVQAIQYIIRTYARVTVSTPDGCFEAAPESIAEDGGKITLTFRVIEKVSN